MERSQTLSQAFSLTYPGTAVAEDIGHAPLVQDCTFPAIPGVLSSFCAALYGHHVPSWLSQCGGRATFPGGPWPF